jgi:hypothetical protein
VQGSVRNTQLVRRGAEVAEPLSRSALRGLTPVIPEGDVQWAT